MADKELIRIEHRERHLDLHKKLDELFTDFIQHGNGNTTNTILDLITWSYKQNIKPDH